MSSKNGKGVVVTTAHRGVFFGYLDGKSRKDAKIVTITRARMCVYWSADVKGVLGLAATGPSNDCRVGPAVPAITLQDVTSVMEASNDAIKAWETIIWK